MSTTLAVAALGAVSIAVASNHRATSSAAASAPAAASAGAASAAAPVVVRTLGAGTNATPTGALGLKTYTVTELALPQPVTATVAGASVTTSTAYRLTITGGPFVPRDIPPTVYVNGQAVGYGQESPDLSSISVTVLDPAALPTGASVSVAYGTSDGSSTQLTERLDLHA